MKNIEILKRREKILQKIPEIKHNAEISLKEKEILDQDLSAAQRIVIDYVKINKRKIYGGLAIHFALISKNHKGIYDSFDNIDIDFYSPDPNKDTVEITNALLRTGYENVSAKEAQHVGTIKIKTRRDDVADITYSWIYNYNKIPYMETKDGFRFVSPEYQIIDIYHTFIDPLFGWYKIDKNIIRASLIEEYFLIQKLPNLIQYFNLNHEYNNSERYLKMYEKLHDIIKIQHDVVLIDIFAYNIFIKESKINDWQKRSIQNKNLVGYTRNPDKAMNEIIEKLRIKLYKIEFYLPLLEIHGESRKLIIDNNVLLTLYQEDLCFPFQIYDGYKIGSYHLILRMLYIQTFNFIGKNINLYSLYIYMINHLQNAREHWLKKNDKLGIENNIFQELQITCYGTGFKSPFSKETIRILSKNRFQYLPKKPTNDKLPNYVYPNTSGKKYKTIDNSV